MCGAYGFSGYGSQDDVWARFALSNQPKVEASYNIRPTQEALIVTRNSPNRGELRQFGIQAPWNDKQRLINAKSETVHQLPTFKKLFAASRCLVPATFFFEWQKLADGKQPYAFSRKDGGVFSFAGLYTDEGFVILTTRANTLMAPIHSRMPCLLSQQQETVWLDDTTSQVKLLELLQPSPSSAMKCWPVSSLVNNARNDFPEVLKPVE